MKREGGALLARQDDRSWKLSQLSENDWVLIFASRWLRRGMNAPFSLTGDCAHVSSAGDADGDPDRAQRQRARAG